MRMKLAQHAGTKFVRKKKNIARIMKGALKDSGIVGRKEYISRFLLT